MKKEEFRAKIERKNKRNDRIMAIVGISVMTVVAVAAVLIVLLPGSGGTQQSDSERIIGVWTEEAGRYRYTFDGRELKIEENVGGEMQVRVYRQYAVGKSNHILRLATDSGRYTDLTFAFEDDRLILTYTDGESMTFIRDR